MCFASSLNTGVLNSVYRNGPYVYFSKTLDYSVLAWNKLATLTIPLSTVTTILRNSNVEHLKLCLCFLSFSLESVKNLFHLIPEVTGSSPGRFRRIFPISSLCHHKGLRHCGWKTHRIPFGGCLSQCRPSVGNTITWTVMRDHKTSNSGSISYS